MCTGDVKGLSQNALIRNKYGRMCLQKRSRIQFSNFLRCVPNHDAAPHLLVDLEAELLPHPDVPQAKPHDPTSRQYALQRLRNHRERWARNCLELTTGRVAANQVRKSQSLFNSIFFFYNSRCLDLGSCWRNKEQGIPTPYFDELGILGHFRFVLLQCV